MENKLSEAITKKIQELQILEQNFQNLLLQRQAFGMELNETSEASEELKTAKEGVYKIIGQLIVKVKKGEIEKDLHSKKELLELRMKNIEKQEQSVKERLLKLREEVMKELQ